jgi:hypothetical protein
MEKFKNSKIKRRKKRKCFKGKNDDWSYNINTDEKKIKIKSKFRRKKN